MAGGGTSEAQTGQHLRPAGRFRHRIATAVHELSQRLANGDAAGKAAAIEQMLVKLMPMALVINTRVLSKLLANC